MWIEMKRTAALVALLAIPSMAHAKADYSACQLTEAQTFQQIAEMNKDNSEFARASTAFDRAMQGTDPELMAQTNAVLRELTHKLAAKAKVRNACVDKADAEEAVRQEAAEREAEKQAVIAREIAKEQARKDALVSCQAHIEAENTGARQSGYSGPFITMAESMARECPSLLAAQ